MTKLLVVAPLVFALAGCASMGPVLTTQDEPADQGAVGEVGCGPATEPSFRDDRAESDRVDREPRLAITSLPRSSVDEAREMGFLAEVPDPPSGVARQYVTVFGDAFAVYFSPETIGDDDTINDVLRRGGAMFTEQVTASGFVADWAERLGDRGAAVAVGEADGVVLHRDPIGQGVRPFELQWESSGRRYQIMAGFDRAGDVIEMARSIEC